MQQARGRGSGDIHDGDALRLRAERDPQGSAGRIDGNVPGPPPDCDAPDCGCAFFPDLRAPLNWRTKVVSVYSRDDPIVPAWSCQIPGAENIEVRGTHSGLAFNGAVYRALAEQLSSG